MLIFLFFANKVYQNQITILIIRFAYNILSISIIVKIIRI
ncbi:protein of unknown function [[Clostridium] ultunense Esp]|uniref:Uncharacterized protein n=1 Tax=[Clostridium] ultunense Esp TaxID=1288971 RepID=A0A1M4PPY9_9FIRM|nr:protein of unknown function [[Clostridium] ultunense Esp]